MADWLGIEEPSLWFMREGLRMVVEAENTVRRIDGAQVLWTLERFGDVLSEVVKEVYPDAQAAWRNRIASDAQSIERLVRINLGSEERAQELFDRKIIELPIRRSDAMRGLDAVLAAARMWPAFVPVDDLARVATEIRAVSRSATPELDTLSDEAFTFIDGDDEKRPRDSAMKLARWLRERLGLTDLDRVDPKQILEAWGVLIRRMSLIEQIDAVSFWGDQHGPCILLNPDSRKASTGTLDQDGLTGAMRFTLAHEICHLLVDRKGSLPVAEVLGGATPARSETRADIFASHFLLPFAAVERQRAHSYGFEDCIGRLTASFGVSRSLAAAQLLWRYYNSLSQTERDSLGRMITGHTPWVVR
jgi:Zn-dependent peptidase ImmA (M78 family)